MICELRFLLPLLCSRNLQYYNMISCKYKIVVVIVIVVVFNVVAIVVVDIVV